jgi:hypothetical protein
MLTVQQHVGREWLNARCHLLELAAILDRIDRSGGPDAAADPVHRRLQALLRIVVEPPAGGDRTTAILKELSDPV